MRTKTKFLSQIVIVIILLLIIIAKVNSKYTPTTMIYQLKPNESRLDVAKRFNVKLEDMKIEDDYLVFEVKP